ncbi:hypothetical protein IMZ08_00290 [Bacillus luteolus]|uniref:Uncharacterized protein n=1 Tax=Litchfieldia luteola TaxID=682179 RepID=A0ABR9QDF1_9BACI|nr:hypothetical protein [Cytobacillus luteolus]MBE4906493.1 hypothetical protein [Cytobacillus luteolus]MBP1941176.1 hypothetical protein [Cytobacillus luteolus]
MRDLKVLTLDLIDNSILCNRAKADETIKLTSTNTRRKKSRTRSKGEVVALNEISISRWKKAVESGKIVSLGERVFYYDYN